MAATQQKKAPVGSSGWLEGERKEIGKLTGEAADDFGYNVRNELEWLNEHMAEIFSKDKKYVKHSFPQRLIMPC